MKKFFAFAALTICLVGCGSDVPTLENECKDMEVNNVYDRLP